MSDTQTATAETTTWNTRGVYYFKGRVRCPMAGIGARGDYESNRIALDNSDSTVTLDRKAGRITVENRVPYPEKSVVADLTFLAEGIHKDGSRSPFAIHSKDLQDSATSSRSTCTGTCAVRHEMVDVQVEEFEVIATDGKQRHVFLNADKIDDALQEARAWALRIIKAFMAMRSNLDGRSNRIPRHAGLQDRRHVPGLWHQSLCLDDVPGRAGIPVG